MARYTIRYAENGTAIEDAATIEEARKIITQFEKEDEEEGTYEPDCYEVYDCEEKQIVY